MFQLSRPHQDNCWRSQTTKRSGEPRLRSTESARHSRQITGQRSMAAATERDTPATPWRSARRKPRVFRSGSLFRHVARVKEGNEDCGRVPGPAVAPRPTTPAAATIARTTSASAFARAPLTMAGVAECQPSHDETFLPETETD